MGGLAEQNTPFFTVKTLITRLLELDSCKNIHEREQLVLDLVTDEETRKHLPLLNDILVLKVCQYAEGPFRCYSIMQYICSSHKRHLHYTCPTLRGQRHCIVFSSALSIR